MVKSKHLNKYIYTCEAPSVEVAGYNSIADVVVVVSDETTISNGSTMEQHCVDNAIIEEQSPIGNGSTIVENVAGPDVEVQLDIYLYIYIYIYICMIVTANIYIYIYIYI